MYKIVLSGVAFAMMGSSLFAGGNIAPVETVVEPMVEVESSSFYTAGLKVGTLGVGAELSIPVNESLSARFSVNGLSYSDQDVYDDDGSEIAYDASIDLLTVGLLLDYYPMVESQFRLTAGAYYNGNGFDALGEPTAGTYDIDGIEYQADDIGALTADSDFDNIAPYIGIGWGNKGTEAGWSFSLDVGAMYHGEAKLNANVTRGAGIPADDGGQNDILFDQIQDGVETERQNAQDDLNDFQWYPVIMVGVTYTF